MDNLDSLRVASRMLAALTDNDTPQAADLRAVLADPHKVTLGTVRDVSDLVGVPASVFFAKEAA